MEIIFRVKEQVHMIFVMYFGMMLRVDASLRAVCRLVRTNEDGTEL